MIVFLIIVVVGLLAPRYGVDSRPDFKDHCNRHGR
jgi:hypothetical protein